MAQQSQNNHKECSCNGKKMKELEKEISQLRREIEIIKKVLTNR